MKQVSLIAVAALMSSAALAEETAFTPEELSVAKFWEEMGPTLRDEGIEAYAIRYHEDLRHWDIEGAGGMATKESVIGFWSKFHEAGNRITCTYVKPITIDIVGDRAFARLEYEQTNTYADGRKTTGVWRMVDIFERHGDTWQVLESNMIDIAPKPEDEKPNDENAYKFHCPNK